MEAPSITNLRVFVIWWKSYMLCQMSFLLYYIIFYKLLYTGWLWLSWWEESPMAWNDASILTRFFQSFLDSGFWSFFKNLILLLWGLMKITSSFMTFLAVTMDPPSIVTAVFLPYSNKSSIFLIIWNSESNLLFQSVKISHSAELLHVSWYRYCCC